MRFKILTLNNISVAGLQHLPREYYEVASEIQHPDAILLRSYDLHDFQIPVSLRAVARAGVGVNNVPVETLTEHGIPVFNAPGANANAVKELVVAGMLLAARNICPAWAYVRNLAGDSEQLEQAVEQGKKQFVGYELPRRVLGVIGLGAIGVEVANVALNLGMRVIGYDPGMTVERAWQLSSSVEQANSLDDLLLRSDMVSLHVPLNQHTRKLIDSERLALLRKGSVLLNFSRASIVDEDDLLEALNQGLLSSYICDFPSPLLKDHPQVVALPHLGASTMEAEDNCAVMVIENMREYLESGNIRHSVNFPDSVMPKAGNCRLTVANRNVPNMLGQISTCLAKGGLNILDMLNQSRGEVAYTVVDLDQMVPDETYQEIASIEGVLAARVI
ncbi:MAG: phosphoglycerate dehydrogenase [Gammaproteobacteria bacterium]|jgi:D-3-phosphoglycerate dehydrogenase|nr:phosphoglycerate dehydrogenase [Gammaproteobacteria bacterium]